MSNTGIKGVTAVYDEDDELVGYMVRAMWKGTRLQTWMRADEYTLEDAREERQRLDRELNRPVTEGIIRSSGVLPQRIGSSDKLRVYEWKH